MDVCPQDVPARFKLWRQKDMVAYTVNGSGADPVCPLVALSELNFIDKVRQVQAEKSQNILAKKGKILFLTTE